LIEKAFFGRGEMLETIYRMIEAAASSTHAALIISIAMNVALAWGWWRREQVHTQEGERNRSDWITRENSFLEILGQRDEEVEALSREALNALQEVAGALAGMERTLDGVETLVHIVLNNKLKGEEDEQ
jgi:hypothetical protein